MVVVGGWWRRWRVEVAAVVVLAATVLAVTVRSTEWVWPKDGRPGGQTNQSSDPVQPVMSTSASKPAGKPAIKQPEKKHSVCGLVDAPT